MPDAAPVAKTKKAKSSENVLSRAGGTGDMIPRDRRAAFLEQMMLSRECDRRSGIVLRQGQAWFHISSAGHEALAALCELLEPEDLIFPHYRDRTLMLARGMDAEGQARDLMAKGGSHSAGRNMSSHFSHRPGNVFSLASPTGSQCLPAAGAAWASVLRGEKQVVVCSIGDASTRQGEFFEAVAFAVERKLPVVFLVSDNRYGISTPTDGLSPQRLGLMPDAITKVVDGSDPDAVHAAAAAVLPDVRAGRGPAVLWCRLDRLDSHTSSDDQRLYRTKDELAAMRDPVALFTDRLEAEGTIIPGWADQVRARLADDVEEVFDRVAEEPSAHPGQVMDHLFAAADEQPTAPADTRPCGGTMVEAVNRALRTGLESDPTLVLFGEDIEDPKGGVFGFTKGLGTLAGPRMTNSPLAEATIVGAAVGLAAAGMRPVVELQFVDFAGPAWNQIASQLTTLRWRTASAWRCPVVIYAPWGGYLPGGGIWHSQSNESLFTHLPGLRVVVPSTPEDTEAVFLESFASPDPTLILLPKHLMRRQHPPQPGPAPARGARLLRTGADVTIATWGNGTELATEAADRLAAEGVGTEVIDLRWLTPLDREAVAASVRRTGRLVVVQEDNRTSSFGATVLADLLGSDDEFYSLLAPPRLVSRRDVHIPFHPDLESAVLPAADDVVAAIRSVLA
ncbi:alpha-ketoacid dehydrogenase subunit alpha/beta [Streptomyces sp. NBC_01294]|uniref:alpha-ketoacid dehydrogenase subunit alpha/beta n=1 Tax=Streptomyces sp. NBC_01294 TaxID=2903815 RepID=UPI002DD932D6|nr:thiamine pyrophosphate-dependent enzyme [Streptomyces sp. NBC_01294]WRZ62229.1 thiamine pyrophosphate-dependent enzyme [Streptomyces sp. NBC_01294]